MNYDGLCNQHLLFITTLSKMMIRLNKKITQISPALVLVCVYSRLSLSHSCSFAKGQKGLSYLVRYTNIDCND
jgi:hypothetical protein